MSADVMSPPQRRKAMAHNRGRTRPERALASGLWRRGLRYFTHVGYRSLTGLRLRGQPDMVFPRKRLVLFVDGCFWHGCVECDKRPEQSGARWAEKIAANKQRDLRTTAALESEGWTVLRVPEHAVRTKASLAQTLDDLAPLIKAAHGGGHPDYMLQDFVWQGRMPFATPYTAVSLFSGAGLSDLGYQMAGFRFHVQVELDSRRAEVGAKNFPESKWLTTDVCSAEDEVVAAYRDATSSPLDLLTATPPCQGMSTSNPSRGKRRTPQAEALESKNTLLLATVPIALALEPRVIVIENVRQILTLEVEKDEKKQNIIDVLDEKLSDYHVYKDVVNMADYGIPQVRKRAIIVAIRKSEPWAKSLSDSNSGYLPSPTHAEHSPNGLRPWLSVREWLESMGYQPLDASSRETAHGEHPLHYVPAYGADRYAQVSQIPPHSGRSAYQNDKCPTCEHAPVPMGAILCPECNSVMRNKPYVENGGDPYLIKGFDSSYRRMKSDRPAYTITSNTSHVGSDFKIHPWENRVLSPLECADLQTVPRFYDWAPAHEKGRRYLVRNLVGEALPPYFTYLHGRLLSRLLSGNGASL